MIKCKNCGHTRGSHALEQGECYFPPDNYELDTYGCNCKRFEP